MKLPFLSKNKVVSNYFGLLLKEDQGIALIIKKERVAATVVDSERFSYSNGWEHLIEDVDEVLFRLESKHNLRLEESIFFVYSHLVDEKTGQIKKSYQSVIKNLAKNLELKPLGFIDCREAVAKFLAKKEEMELTAILIELDQTNAGIFVYKVGQSVFDKVVARTDNLIDDLNSVFQEVKGKLLLPARIVLYNSKDLDFAVTRILSHRWSSDLFIQLPKVEVIQEKEILVSLVDAFNQQTKEEKEEPVVSRTVKTKTGFLIDEDIKETEGESPPIIKKEISFSGIKNFFSKFHWPKFNFLFGKNNNQKKVLLVLGFIISASALFLNEYYLHQAKLRLYVPSLNLKKTISITVAEKGNVDLIVKPVTQTINISSSSSTSGKKEVGDFARGEVTVYNFSKETIFNKGTTIEANDLSFTFDDDVKIASSSLTSDASAKLPGKTKVKITAAVIGDGSNLAKGQTFKIDNQDSETYFAKNESDFSGGSKKQITTVSKQDYKNLADEVLKKAKEQKPTDFKLSSDEKTIPQLSETAMTDSNYSKEIGEEASSVNLSAKVETTIYTYKKSELLNLLYPYLSKDVKTGFVLDKNKISYQINELEKGKEENSLNISVSAKAIKTIGKDQVIKILLRKNKNDIEKVIKDNFSITGYNLDLKQPLPIPYLNQSLPFFRKNFQIEIDSL
ncbi:hypothetical protein COY89_02045 [Candidatus Roizmanbacteria bacterium CG_4_10_14_0_8_um_filter_36_36]|uniref:Baseplate protein J-like domain-containing protein n=1 Tax=Candidatus Roizmanbacteria bacterium CG_4_8_14_3_um_filter_36_10 TaxID=1974834 RepID=A0A2M8GLD1_9BACT|nr:MAG: hypothetical protein COY89_02045 [Candidatus Roizmanbacteria bacterium CG_4_10_14_0_8_um_filter_36_36]PJA53372.1 MAG: hypothetical protein CO166_02145 [Candidatus Roizmanbacteria bacterium CG_4_9_14_3_um_filter_36_11]PJC81366.1 MAG: hypothetical protein CO007_05195 [Candidatus Roizmanbacteria bacterium CG_4_8_14_3_um_filter_36_10]